MSRQTPPDPDLPSPAPTPDQIYRRAVKEGQRRLDMSMLDLVTTGFNAGFTIVLGVAALGAVTALTEPTVGPELAKVAGAAAFAIGLVFLTTSRSELFTENFFDPVATAFDRRGASMIGRLLRLWFVVLAMNLVGGALLVLILSIDGVLPAGAEEALRHVAEEIEAKSTLAAFANALVGGALVTLLSFLLQAVDRVISRIVLSFLVGFVLAVAPFAHVVVTFQHLLAGLLAGAHLPAGTLATETLVAIAGNMVGGLAFVTLSHIAQARSEEG